MDNKHISLHPAWLTSRHLNLLMCSRGFLLLCPPAWEVRGGQGADPQGNHPDPGHVDGEGGRAHGRPGGGHLRAGRQGGGGRRAGGRERHARDRGQLRQKGQMLRTESVNHRNKWVQKALQRRNSVLGGEIGVMVITCGPAQISVAVETTTPAERSESDYSW